MGVFFGNNLKSVVQNSRRLLEKSVFMLRSRKQGLLRIRSGISGPLTLLFFEYLFWTIKSGHFRNNKQKYLLSIVRNRYTNNYYTLSIPWPIDYLDHKGRKFQKKLPVVRKLKLISEEPTFLAMKYEKYKYPIETYKTYSFYEMSSDMTFSKNSNWVILNEIKFHENQVLEQRQKILEY